MTTSRVPPPVHVIGLGNVLMGDDALGPWVIQELEAGWEFPPEVAVTDAGTPGLDLTPYLSGYRHVVLVDTVKAEGRPGDLRVYSKADVLRHPLQPRLSPHDPGVKETLMLLDFAGEGPETMTLVGVVPGVVAKGNHLSDEVRAAVPRAAAAVVAELERLGTPPRRRAAAPPAEPWWEREPEPAVAR